MHRFLVSALAVCLFGPSVLAQVDPRALVITVIDIGQGDSILIEFPEYADGTRKTMLIDGGVSTSANNAVVQLLTTKGINTLDIVVLTHPHNDHYSGLTPIFENGSIVVDEFWWTGETRGPHRGDTKVWIGMKEPE